MSSVAVWSFRFGSTTMGVTVAATYEIKRKRTLIKHLQLTVRSVKSTILAVTMTSKYQNI